MNIFKKLKFLTEKRALDLLKVQLYTIIDLKIDNKIVFQKIGKSLTTNFLQNIYGCFRNSSSAFQNSPEYGSYSYYTYIKKVDGNESYLASDSYAGMSINGGSSDDNRGIVIGLDSTAVTPKDYKLGNKISEGVNTNQFNYGLQTASQGPVVIGNETSFVINRLFTNNSPNPISVSELGIYAYSSSDSISWMLYRDLVTANVLAGQVLNVGITFKITT